MADQSGGWDDDSKIGGSRAQGFFEFAEDVCGLAGAGCTTDKPHLIVMANKRRNKMMSLDYHSGPRYHCRIRVITGTLRFRVRNLTRGTSIGDAIDTAESSAERRTGLLKHDKLDEGAGLWIIPCEAVHTFFMKFAIDLIYLDRKRKVRGIVRALPPWRFSLPARALGAGIAARHHRSHEYAEGRRVGAPQRLTAM